MAVHWLIEVDIFADTAKRIISALESRSLPWTRYDDDTHAAQLPPVDMPVIFWGSLGAAYVDRVAARWSPGAVGDVRRFHCSEYYGQFPGVPLANSDAVFTTVAALVRSPAATVAALGKPDHTFVRPDSPLKPFSGRPLSIDDVSLATLDYGFYYNDEQLPVVVSTLKDVGREWRFVVADRIVVADCEYRASREGVGTDVPDTARQVATMVAEAGWQAAPLYVVDIAEVNGDPHVMELNPFSGADLYYCDPTSVAKAASRVAQRLFERHGS